MMKKTCVYCSKDSISSTNLLNQLCPPTPTRHRLHPDGNHSHEGPQRVQGKDDELFNNIADTKDEHSDSMGLPHPSSRRIAEGHRL